MLKGFGKQTKLTGDDRQFFVANSILTILGDNPPKQIGLGQNKVFYFAPTQRIKSKGGQMGWNILTRDMRWDLLNPGQPNLVPLVATCSHGIKSLEDEAKNTLTAVYDRAVKQVTFALSLDNYSDEDAAIICSDLDGKKVIEPAEETTDALRRLTQWSTYQMVKLYMRKEQHDELLPKIAEEIGIEHKLLQAV